MIENKILGSKWVSPMAIAVYLALGKLLLHFVAMNNYGYFRDELYFLAGSRHLDWGYVDHAPMIAGVTWFMTQLFGVSLYALRVLPAVAGAAKIILTGLIVKELGGKRWATLLACLGVLVAPVYFGMEAYLSMNAFEPLFVLGSIYLLIIAIKRADYRWLLGVGALVGLGLENKHSMMIFAVGLLCGLLVTKQWQVFKSKWLWLGALIALVLFLPNVVWEYQHDWATFEGLRNVQETGKNIRFSVTGFLGEQVFTLLPLTLPLWLAGLWYLLLDKEGKKYRYLGVAFVVVFGLMALMKAKFYYIMPIYPVLFAAGGVFWERFIVKKRRRKWVGVGYAGTLMIGGLLFLPIALPILPIERFIDFQEVIGLAPPKTEVGHVGPLPQNYGDMFGWPEMVRAVAEVYHELPEEEKEVAGILTLNYGEAGAIDLYGPEYGLPEALSGHQNNYFWGPRGYSGEVLILMGWKREWVEDYCESVEEKAEVGHEYAMAEEHFTILICRNTVKPLNELWPELKAWN